MTTSFKNKFAIFKCLVLNKQIIFLKKNWKKNCLFCWFWRSWSRSSTDTRRTIASSSVRRSRRRSTRVRKTWTFIDVFLDIKEIYKYIKIENKRYKNHIKETFRTLTWLLGTSLGGGCQEIVEFWKELLWCRADGLEALGGNSGGTSCPYTWANLKAFCSWSVFLIGAGTEPCVADPRVSLYRTPWTVPMGLKRKK